MVIPIIHELSSLKASKGTFIGRAPFLGAGVNKSITFVESPPDSTTALLIGASFSMSSSWLISNNLNDYVKESIFNSTRVV